jgi:hypothetical protein
MQPLSASLAGYAFARPEPQPPKRKIRQADRANHWRRDLERKCGDLIGRATTAADRAAIEAAYIQESALGPGFLRCRRNAVFSEDRSTKLNREGLARLERAWAFLARKMTETDRKAARDRGGTTRRTLSRSTIDVLGALLWLARKHRTVFASIEGIARLASVCRRTAADALKTLESWGVLEITRRRKRVTSPTGRACEAQDTSLYCLKAPEGLAAMALRVFGWGTGCKERTAEESKNRASDEEVQVAAASPANSGLIPVPSSAPGMSRRIPWQAMLKR